MKSFLRVIRLARRNRMTVAGVVLTALLVGVLWGANIGAAYPFVEVIFHDQSLHTWVDSEIKQASETSDELQESINTLNERRQRTAPEQRRSIDRDLAQLTHRLDAEQEALERLEWLAPYIRSYAPRDAFETLVYIVIALIIGTLLKDVAIAANFILAVRLSELILIDIRKMLFRRAVRWDLSQFGASHNSRLLSHFTNDTGKLHNALKGIFGSALVEPFKMMACLAGACWISWRLLALSLLISPPALYLLRKLSRLIKQANHRSMEQMTEVYRVLNESLAGIQTVKAFTMERFERNRFYLSLKARFRTALKISVYNSLTRPTTELLGVGVICLALLAGAYLVLKEKTHLFGIPICDRPMSLGSLFLFYGMLAGASGPARKLSSIYMSIQGGLAAAERIYAVIDREPTIVNSVSPRAFPRPFQRLVLEQLDFEYEAGEPILQGVNLEIRAGETVAIVGPNGCGKSTLINLIPRFYDPTAGSVRLDDVDIRQIRLPELRRRIGVVTQQTYLFDDSVLNNIRYGTLQADYDEVVAAAKRAHADGFITNTLPDGYQTLVGQRGNRLSGGQCQRIALARAILRDPDILILDEATSQIDIASEQAIHHALAKFVQGRTSIIVTHRLSTLQLADRIVVMDAGRIVDLGTSDELLARCATYRRLHDIHFRQTG